MVFYATGVGYPSGMCRVCLAGWDIVAGWVS